MQNTKTDLKYLNALRDLQQVLKYTNKISLTKFMNDNSLNKNFSTIIVKGGLIKTNGSIGAGIKYEWNTIDANINMAKEVHIKVNQISNDGVKKTRGGKREGSGRKTKLIENRFLESYTTYFFFGLIKIKTELNYKNM